MKAASLVTTTIRPLPCPLKVGSSARVSARTPKKFVSITRRSSASGTSSKAPAVATPALCTTASSLLPVRESIVSVAARIDVPLVTSSCAISTPFCTPASFSVGQVGLLARVADSGEYAPATLSEDDGSRLVDATRRPSDQYGPHCLSGSPVKVLLVLFASFGRHSTALGKARQDDVPTLV